MAKILDTGKQIHKQQPMWELLIYNPNGSSMYYHPLEGSLEADYKTIKEVLQDGWEPCGSEGDGDRLLFKRRFEIVPMGKDTHGRALVQKSGNQRRKVPGSAS